MYCVFGVDYIRCALDKTVLAQIEQKYSKRTILELKDISKSFIHGEKREILKHQKVLGRLDLKVEEGEFLTIVGSSGCGKSTLLNIIAGIDRPDSGSISAKDDKARARGAESILIFQESALFPWLTVFGNVEFGLKIAGIPKEQRREIANHFIEVVQLAKFADSYVFQLSGGMKQRAAIARALALDPQILLMDEPFAALDVQTRDVLLEQLLQIHRSTSKTILFVTHNIDEAIKLGDRIVLLSSQSAGIKREIIINYPKPRDIESPEITAIRRNLLKDLQEDFRLARSNPQNY
jgi:NitT/TauT family transport system ATP-binding protein